MANSTSDNPLVLSSTITSNNELSSLEEIIVWDDDSTFNIDLVVSEREIKKLLWKN